MEIMVQKTLSGVLKPCYESDHDNFKKLPLNESFLITYTKKRNIKFHRKFFALMQLVYQNQELYRFLDDLRQDITIECGYYYETVNINGEVVKKAKSISFASMDEVEFSELYNTALDVIVKHFHFDKEDMLTNIEQYY